MVKESKKSIEILEKKVFVRRGENIRLVDPNCILMAKRKGQKVKIITENSFAQDYYVSFSLKKLEEYFSNFFKCHRSTVVNLDKIKEYNIKKRVLTLINGHKVLVSRRKGRCLNRLLKKQLKK